VQIVDRKHIKIGLFGFGVVGKGLYDVLKETPGFKADIEKICVKDKAKTRPIGMENFTFDKSEILNNPEINVVVELIDDAEEAFKITKEAILRGKSVVTANKKMVSDNIQELLGLQNASGLPVLYEASCCASIPILRNLEEYYDNDLLTSLSGIVNGTTNFILTKMSHEGIEFETALRIAQEKGFAESNPSQDIHGIDAQHKLHILILHSFGLIVPFEDILTVGITKINGFDLQYAREKNYKIKLIARSFKAEDNKIIAYVLPTFVNSESFFYKTDNEFNSIVTESAFSDKNVLVGKGAGAYPTASAVLSDLSALTYDYRYEYKKLRQHNFSSLSSDHNIKVYIRTPKSNNLSTIFKDVNEIYENGKYRYITGSINLNDLKFTDYLTHPEVSIIAMP
jgi:homoserine dehydrogenase